MATAAAAAPEAPPPAPKSGGKKKLIIIIAVAVLALLLVGGGAAYFLMKKKPVEADDEEADAHAPAAAASVKAEPKHGAAPVFLPLEPFTVNLADREAERYAQVGLTLEVEDNKVGDQLKAYMPAIRNNILLLLAGKTSAEMLTREGKLKLAQDIRREALRPLGITVKEEADDTAEAADGSKKPKKKSATQYPIRAVHFSNIIIQ